MFSLLGVAEQNVKL